MMPMMQCYFTGWTSFSTWWTVIC